MSEPVNVEKLLAGIRTTEGLGRLDASITEPALQSIRMEFEASSDPFDRHRAMCTQIGAAGSPGLRRMLMRLRDEFETQMLWAALGEIRQAFECSPEDGWRAWVRRLAAAVSVFHLRHSLHLCEEAFPFDSSHQQAVGQIRRAVQCMRQSRWEEAYEEAEFLSKQEFLPVPTRARLVTVVGQIELWRFERAPRARALFDEAQRLAAEDGMVLATLGDYWLMEKNVEAATDYYQRAIAAAPQMASGYTGMGDRFEKDERIEEAEAWYRRAISLAGGDGLGYDRLLRLLGAPSRLQCREAEFLAVLEQRLAVDPEGEYDTY